MTRLVTDASQPDEAAIAHAATLIRRSGVVAIPTDTLYGIAADPFRSDAVQRVFAMKGRTVERALPLVAADLEQVRRWLGVPSTIGLALAARFWPGPLTLLIAAPPQLAPEVTGGLLSIGVRVPAHAVPRALCAACGHPLTATSANISGQPATADPDEVERQLGTALDALLDAGPTPGGAPSTIVDITSSDPRLVRAGAIAWDEIQACLDRR